MQYVCFRHEDRSAFTDRVVSQRRHQELVTVIRAEPDIYTNAISRDGATTAWEAYCESMVNEWESANVIVRTAGFKESSR